MTTFQPLVSCIMPTANRQRFIPTAISLFLRQDYPEKELVIIDDGEHSVVDQEAPFGYSEASAQGGNKGTFLSFSDLMPMSPLEERDLLGEVKVLRFICRFKLGKLKPMRC